LRQERGPKRAGKGKQREWSGKEARDSRIFAAAQIDPAYSPGGTNVHLYLIHICVGWHKSAFHPNGISIRSTAFCRSRGCSQHADTQTDHATSFVTIDRIDAVRQQVIFKTAVLVWKCIHSGAPVYLEELCTRVDSICGRRRLRSTGCIQLPRVQTSVAQRSSAYNRLAVWNSLPATMQAATESVLICSVMNTIRRCCGVFASLTPSYKTLDLLTYLCDAA